MSFEYSPSDGREVHYPDRGGNGLRPPIHVADADQLARWVQWRDERALEMIIDYHREMVTGVCRRILGSRMDAEEVANEVFADLAREAAAIHASPAAWLRRVATHRALRHLRRRRCRIAGSVLRGDEPSPSDRDDRTGDEDMPRRIQARLANALETLGEQERDTLVQHFFGTASTTLIARRSGVSVHAVRKRITTALGRLSRLESVRGLYAEIV